MKKTMICLAVLFVVSGLCATVYAQAGGHRGGGASNLKICKPGEIPVLYSGRIESQFFQAESHFEAQCTCNRVAVKYKQYVCYATPHLAEGGLWTCLCRKTKP